MNRIKTPAETTVGLTTLGCKVNQCETAALAKAIQEKGFRLVPFSSAADYYIINTCTVTASSDFQARQLLRRASRRNPLAKIIVTGCYAQRAPLDLAALDNSSLIIGNDYKNKIIDILQEEKTFFQKRMLVNDIRQQDKFINLPAADSYDRTRAFLKIQDGCDAFCSYCIIPLVRGRSRSLPPEQVLKSLENFINNGYKEIVLTGIHLGFYGRDLNPSASLADILKRIYLLKPDARIRLSSIEPLEITDDLLSLLTNHDIFCPHLHIPLQSGDDKILKLMRRNYNTRSYRRIIDKTFLALPHAAVGTDIMVGFPGEGDKEFNNTLALLRDLPLAYLHVFPYSERPQTAAQQLPDKVPAPVKKERAAVLRNLGLQKKEEFAGRFLGKKLNILIEKTKDKKTGLPKGFSENYLSVLLENNDRAAANMIVALHITKLQQGRLYGKTSNG